MRIRRGVVCMALGAVCLAGAMGLAAANRIEEMHGEQSANRMGEILREEVIPEISDEQVGYGTTATQMQTAEIDGQEYIGILTLPSLNLELPVLFYWSDELLKQSPCLYKGSYLEDTMIIAGHNYRRHFSGIKNMRQGDEISFTDVNGAVYRYQVDSLENIEGTDLEGMESGEWDLTLFTCTYGGQDRVAVRCIRN